MNKPKVQLSGKDGNIFVLMGVASEELKRNNMKEEAEEMTNRIFFEAGSYEEALHIIQEYLDVY